jgi:hypothetical protein
VEIALRVLRRAGFGVDDAISAFQVVVTFVVGHTLFAHAPRRADEPAAPLADSLARARATSGDELTALTEAASALANHDVEREFQLGLDAMLRGLSSLADS